jgi:hypothetical protein
MSRFAERRPALDLSQRLLPRGVGRRPEDHSEDHCWDEAAPVPQRHAGAKGLDLAAPHAALPDDEMEAAMASRPTQPYASHFNSQQARAAAQPFAFTHPGAFQLHARQSSVHDPSRYELPARRQGSLRDERYDAFGPRSKQQAPSLCGLPHLAHAAHAAEADEEQLGDATEGGASGIDRLLQLAQAASAQRSSDGGTSSAGMAGDAPDAADVQQEAQQQPKPSSCPRALSSIPSADRGADNWPLSPLELPHLPHLALARIRPTVSNISSDTTTLSPTNRKRRADGSPSLAAAAAGAEARGSGTPSTRPRQQHVMYHQQRRSNLRPARQQQQQEEAHDLLFDCDGGRPPLHCACSCPAPLRLCACAEVSCARQGPCPLLLAPLCPRRQPHAQAQRA